MRHDPNDGMVQNMRAEEARNAADASDDSSQYDIQDALDRVLDPRTGGVGYGDDEEQIHAIYSSSYISLHVDELGTVLKLPTDAVAAIVAEKPDEVLADLIKFVLVHVQDARKLGREEGISRNQHDMRVALGIQGYSALSALTKTLTGETTTLAKNLHEHCNDLDAHKL